MVRWTLLNGSAWCIEKKFLRRYKGTSDIFLGVEHRMRKEAMEEQFNFEAKQSWRFAGRVFVAVDSNLGAVIGKEERTVMSNEGLIAQAWVHVRGGMRVFAVYFWHSEGWTPRNEALMEAVV